MPPVAFAICTVYRKPCACVQYDSKERTDKLPRRLPVRSDLWLSRFGNSILKNTSLRLARANPAKTHTRQMADVKKMKTSTEGTRRRTRPATRLLICPARCSLTHELRIQVSKHLKQATIICNAYAAITFISKLWQRETVAAKPRKPPH